MWISPAFGLKVTRAYDAMVSVPMSVAALPDFARSVAVLRERLKASRGKPLDGQGARVLLFMPSA